MTILQSGKNSPFWRAVRTLMDEAVRSLEESSFTEDNIVEANMRARGARDLRNALLNAVEQES